MNTRVLINTDRDTLSISLIILGHDELRRCQLARIEGKSFEGMEFSFDRNSNSRIEGENFHTLHWGCGQSYKNDEKDIQCEI